ncbi:uncharacterized protein DEA37_0014213 [Paragonimus westermani]|uniref:Uncharacterized protein n=1 Tax=Paragonimus westermani TaxID=34504 RepID=A0A5J4NV65_9TREM|nr:uncharacterized protein DEA37_0014213 [Paragonimus westermani]
MESAKAVSVILLLLSLIFAASDAFVPNPWKIMQSALTTGSHGSSLPEFTDSGWIEIVDDGDESPIDSTQPFSSVGMSSQTVDRSTPMHGLRAKSGPNVYVAPQSSRRTKSQQATVKEILRLFDRLDAQTRTKSRARMEERFNRGWRRPGFQRLFGPSLGPLYSNPLFAQHLPPLPPPQPPMFSPGLGGYPQVMWPNVLWPGYSAYNPVPPFEILRPSIIPIRSSVVSTGPANNERPTLPFIGPPKPVPPRGKVFESHPIKGASGLPGPLQPAFGSFKPVPPLNPHMESRLNPHKSLSKQPRIGGAKIPDMNFKRPPPKQSAPTRLSTKPFGKKGGLNNHSL